MEALNQELQQKDQNLLQTQTENERKLQEQMAKIEQERQYKAQVEEQAQGDLQQKLIVAGNEPVQLVNDALVLHLVLVVTKDGQLLEEVKNDEEKIRVVSIKHSEK